MLEVAQWTFVPAAGAVLADWGADVIKIEHPQTGDSQRGLKQLGHIKVEGNRNPVMEHANRGKRSVALDISTPDGHELLMDIVRIQRRVPDQLPARTPARNSRSTSTTSGRSTPTSSTPGAVRTGHSVADAGTGGYDMTGFWSRAAGASWAPRPCDLDGVVPQPGPAYGDSIGGMTIAGGIAAALFERERTGHARVVDISLLGVGSGRPEWRSTPR